MVFEWLLNALWQIGLLSLVAIAVQPLLWNVSADFRHRYWIAASSACVIVPVLSLAFLGLPGAVESPTFLIQATAGPAPTALGPLVDPPRIAVPKELPQFAILGYLVCLGLGLIGFSRSVRTLIALQREADAGRSDPRLNEIVSHCASVLHMSRARAIASDKVHSPITIGFRKPLILVPSDLVHTGDRSKLVAIVGHEMAHIKRKDFPVNLLAQLLVLPIQFHPLTWYLLRKMRRQCELACDEMVTASFMSKRAYARRLLEVAAESIKGGTMRPQLAFGTDSLEERIRTLLAPSKVVQSRWIQRLIMVSACSILLIAGAGTGLVFVHAQDKTAPAGQEPARTRSDEKVYEESDQGVVMPEVLEQTIPRYTEEAISARVEGIVLLECIVRTTGRVTDCRVVRSLGSGLEEVTIREIEDNWRFKPATVEGKPVNLRAKIEVTFNLRLREGEIPRSEAVGLAIEGIELVGLSEEQATSARALLRIQESTKFKTADFQSDVSKLREKFGSASGEVYKGKSGGVIVKYRVKAGR